MLDQRNERPQWEAVRGASFSRRRAQSFQRRKSKLEMARRALGAEQQDSK
jgi:hypothetical protein